MRRALNGGYLIPPNERRKVILDRFYAGFSTGICTEAAGHACFRPGNGWPISAGAPLAVGRARMWPWSSPGGSAIIASREAFVSCEICHNRKEKRFCPAIHGRICPQCCGEQREVDTRLSGGLLLPATGPRTGEDPHAGATCGRGTVPQGGNRAALLLRARAADWRPAVRVDSPGRLAPRLERS